MNALRLELASIAQPLSLVAFTVLLTTEHLTMIAAGELECRIHVRVR